MAEFDAYLIVDWSASNTPKRGADSIWYCLLERAGRSVSSPTLANPATRHDAAVQLQRILRRLAHKGSSTLVGFDFPYGYPHQFAVKAGLAGKCTKAWKAIWNYLKEQIEDDQANANNRFTVASELNRKASGGSYPFWGCPRGRSLEHLFTRKSHRVGARDLPEYRITESCAKGPQSAWQLFGAVSVGSQALVGMPHVRAIRYDPELQSVSRVWPFETGLRPLAQREKRKWKILHAEVYPSLEKVSVSKGEIKDRSQVLALARKFARLDDVAELSSCFAGSCLLSPEQKLRVESEEGWILGVR